MKRVGAVLMLLLSLQAVTVLAADAAAPATSPSVNDAASMGRLFFTPAQRATLDEMRRRPQPSAAVTDDKAALPPPPEYVTLNGIVRRNDGTTTVWLNDRQVRDRESAEGLQITPSRRPGTTAGNVRVLVPQTGHVVDLKVGQQLEVNSGEVKERYRAPPRAVTAPAAAVAATDTVPARERRAARDRDALRDLLREIESPPSATGSPPQSAASDPTR